MIRGEVNEYSEAIIHLAVRAPDGSEREIEAVIDTGFNGSLTLPSAVITAFRLPWRSRGLVTLANGTEDQCDIFAASVVWDGSPRHILVEAAETDPLVGMMLLQGYRLRVDVIQGGSVIIETLP